MPKALKSLLGFHWKKKCDKIIYCKQYGEEGNYKIIDYDYIEPTTDKVSYNEKTVRIPDSNIQNEHGQFLSYVDVDKGTVLSFENVDGESLDSGVSDSFLSQNLIKRFIDRFGESGWDYEMLAIGLLAGGGVGFALGQFIVRYMMTP